jgi:hypothetical protein
MSAHKTQELPRMVCPHCYLSTRADMPKCLYCGTPLHQAKKPAAPTRRQGTEALPHSEMSHRARATLSRWR